MARRPCVGYYVRASAARGSRHTGDSALNGYSIVEADSLDGAKTLADQHPFLTEGKGRFSVEVFELVPM